MRTFVIGDIHGCYDELIELMEKVNLQEEDLIISLGDIVDRGNKSKEVYDFFRNRKNSIVLMGNHERKHLNGILSYAQEIVKVQFGDEYQNFLNWLETLEYSYETDEAIIVHAFFEHDKQLSNQKQDVLSGSTSGDRYLQKKYPEGKFWNEFYVGIKPIIYGHHVVGDAPKIFNNTYGLDTGCCHGNYLTAIELPTFNIHQVRAKKDYWIEEQKKWQIPVLKNKDWNNMTFEEIEKQISKLSYLQDNEIQNYLKELEKWKADTKDSLVIVKHRIEELCFQLSEKFGNTFNDEAKKFSFNRYLFLSKTNRLKLEDLEKHLNTPNKVSEILFELDNKK